LQVYQGMHRGWRRGYGSITGILAAVFASLEKGLDRQTDGLPLLAPVAIGCGIAVWEINGFAAIWVLLPLCAAFASIAFVLPKGSLSAAVLRWSGILIMIGFAAISFRSAWVEAPRLDRMWIGEFYGRIERVEQISARDIVRFEINTAQHKIQDKDNINQLPRRIRVNLDKDKFRAEYKPGAVLKIKARLVPPAGPNVPGAYDFARRAWFASIGATGTVLGEPTLYAAAPSDPLLSSMRQRLNAHIMQQMPPDQAAIATALATGERGAISERDSQAMRDSGMAHLLSISGLHVTAVVGAIFLICSRFLALFPYIALRFSVPIIAAAVASLGAIGYTLLTGSDVPTIRSCIASLIILAALAMGREALSLRVVAFGALVILLIRPESLAGPSFQLSFAAVASIIILHDSEWMRRFLASREEGMLAKLSRGLVSLLITGIVIECVLSPIALYHFHRTGLYGALANVIAIPLTTFVIMPFEALALIFDCIGLGAPFWWIAGKGLAIILAMARMISDAPGSLSSLPNMPNWAFICMAIGALWIGILKGRIRAFGLAPAAIGLAAMLMSPSPDILVTGDGKHVAVTNENGQYALLRDRAGDYIKDSLAENAGIIGDPVAIDSWPGAKCNPDSCVITMNRGGRDWYILALRSRYLISSMELAAACRRADIVIADRGLPASCKPRWFRADRYFLKETGGLALYLDDQIVQTVAEEKLHAPWRQNILLNQAYQKVIDYKKL
jgi:competence protein ComEC